MADKKTNPVYIEPDDYIPESIQKELKIGKYWEDPEAKKAEEKSEMSKESRKIADGK